MKSNNHFLQNLILSEVVNFKEENEALDELGRR